MYFQVFLLFVALSAASHYFLNTSPGWSVLILIVGAGVTGFAALQTSLQPEPKKLEPPAPPPPLPTPPQLNLQEVEQRIEELFKQNKQ